MKDSSWGIMRTVSRFKHPSRKIVYDFMKEKYGRFHFTWMDVGVVSMVDYTRLRAEHRKLNFSYIGVDINSDIVKQARTYAKGKDTVLVWDIHETPRQKLLDTPCDIILVKHMLHYCKDYTVLENLLPVLKDDGYIIVINNCNIYTKKNTSDDNGRIMYAFGRWRATFSMKSYREYLDRNFSIVKQKKFKATLTSKPFTLDILQKHEEV